MSQHPQAPIAQALRIDRQQLDTLAAVAVQRAQSARRMAELSAAEVRQVSGGATIALTKGIIAGGDLLKPVLSTSVIQTTTISAATLNTASLKTLG